MRYVSVAGPLQMAGNVTTRAIRPSSRAASPNNPAPRAHHLRLMAGRRCVRAPVGNQGRRPGLLACRSARHRCTSTERSRAPGESHTAARFLGRDFRQLPVWKSQGNRTVNRFELDRAYLDFRVNPADRFAIRLTADVFQQRDTTRDAYSFRAPAMQRGVELKEVV